MILQKEPVKNLTIDRTEAEKILEEAIEPCLQAIVTSIRGGKLPNAVDWRPHFGRMNKLERIFHVPITYTSPLDANLSFEEKRKLMFHETHYESALRSMRNFFLHIRRLMYYKLFINTDENYYPLLEHMNLFLENKKDNDPIMDQMWSSAFSETTSQHESGTYKYVTNINSRGPHFQEEYSPHLKILTDNMEVIIQTFIKLGRHPKFNKHFATPVFQGKIEMLKRYNEMENQMEEGKLGWNLATNKAETISIWKVKQEFRRELELTYGSYDKKSQEGISDYVENRETEYGLYINGGNQEKKKNCSVSFHEYRELRKLLKFLFKRVAREYPQQKF